MLTCKAVEILYNKSGNTIGYRLMDESGKVMDVPSEAIKEALRNKKIRIPNLHVTNNYRLVRVDKAPSKLTNYADKISAVSGLKRSKAHLDGITAQYRFLNTDFILYCYLDEDKVYLRDSLEREREITSTEMLNIIANNIKAISKDELHGGKPNELVIKASDLLKNKLPEYLAGICKKVHAKLKDINIGVKDPNLKMMIIADTGDSITINLNECVLSELIIKNCENSGEQITIESSIINRIDVLRDPNMVCKNGKIRGLSELRLFLRDSVINDVLNIEESRVEITLSYMGIINVHNCTEIYLNMSMANTLNVLNNTDKYNGTIIRGSVPLIKNINAQTTCEGVDLLLFTEMIYAHNICLKTAGKLFIDIRRDNGGASDIVKSFVEEGKYNNVLNTTLYDALMQNGFSGYEGWIANIKTESKSSSIKKFCIDADIDITTSRNIPCDCTYNTHLLDDSNGDITLDSNSELVIASNTNLILHNIVVTKENIRGLALLNDNVHNADITITGDIVMKCNKRMVVYKSSQYSLILSQLRRISNVVNIHVYYNTPIYKKLMTGNIKFDIVDKENIPESTRNRTAKEKLMGMNYWDTLLNILKDACSVQSGTDTYKLECTPIATVPESIISLYDLDVREGHLDLVSYNVLSAINFIKQFPINNLIFTTPIVDIINRDRSQFIIKSSLVVGSGSVTIHKITLAKAFKAEHDTYLVVMNGNVLLHMAYMGELEFKYGLGNNTYMEKAVKEITKLESIDFDTYIISQNITISEIKDIDNLIYYLNNIFENSMMRLEDLKSGIIMTTTGNNNYIAFKISIHTEKGEFIRYAKIASLSARESESAIENLKQKIDEQYKTSIAFAEYCNTQASNKVPETIQKDSDSIPIANPSILRFLSDTYDKSNETVSDIDSIFDLPVFIEVGYEEGAEIWSTKTVEGNGYKGYSIYHTKADVDIKMRRLKRKTKKYETPYVKYVSLITEITYNETSDVRYLLSNVTITMLTNLINSIRDTRNAVSSTEYSFESYIEEFKNLYLEANAGRKNLLKFGVICDVFKSTLYNYDSEYEYYSFVKHYSEAKDLLIDLWSSTISWVTNRNDKKAGAVGKVVIDCMTGICYLVFILAKRVPVPVLRFNSYESALYFISKLTEEEAGSTNNARSGLSCSIVRGDSDYRKLIELQCHNVKDIKEYEKLKVYNELSPYIGYYNPEELTVITLDKLKKAHNQNKNNGNIQIIQLLGTWIAEGKVESLTEIPKGFVEVDRELINNELNVITYSNDKGNYAMDISGNKYLLKL